MSLLRENYIFLLSFTVDVIRTFFLSYHLLFLLFLFIVVFALLGMQLFGGQ